MSPGTLFSFVQAFGDLSLLELISYFRRHGIRFEFIQGSDIVALFLLDGFYSRDAMKHLGGVFKVGCIILGVDRRDFVSQDRLRDFLDKAVFIDSFRDKLSWGMSFYGDSYFDRRVVSTLEDYFKSRFQKEGVRKAKLIRSTKVGNALEIDSYRVERHRLVGEGLDIQVFPAGPKIYFAKTESVIDNEGFRARDLQRPFQRPIFSLPPKLARVLVNVSGVNKGGSILDPFCGFGTILLEALAIGFKVFGLDIDGACVNASIANLNWLARQLGLGQQMISASVRKGDALNLSRHFKPSSIDAIVTEPILLPPLRSKPSSNHASYLLRKVASKYRLFLFEASKVLKSGSRLVLVSPSILTRDKGYLSLDPDALKLSTGFQDHVEKHVHVRQPFRLGAAQEQLVAREIYVLERA